MPLLSAGLEADAVLKDKDTLADVVSGATDEATAGGWNRKTLTDAELSALPAPDDTNDRYDIDLPDQTWTTVSAGNNSGKLLVCYDSDTTGGTDANIVPLAAYDFSVTTDGTNVVAVWDAAGFYRAA